MLGWEITVCRLLDGGASPANSKSSRGVRVAAWRAEAGGTYWLDQLVKAGKAIDLVGDGYPIRYTAMAQHLIQPIFDGPPSVKNDFVWSGAGTTLTHTVVPSVSSMNKDAAAECQPEEWLLVEAWDEDH